MIPIDAAVIAARTRTLIAHMAPEPPNTVLDEQRLIEDLGFDSIRLMELTVALERGFGLPRYAPEQLTDVRRVGDVITLVATTLGTAATTAEEATRG
ncbi:acyl carrier protein [Nocardia sp. NPDC058058]|uniref:acyl carrier protein n=1 Tax=Nocardia sp. NPDC058058 TaxID=3346317 RepID=UPI0036DED7F1